MKQIGPIRIKNAVLITVLIGLSPILGSFALSTPKVAVLDTGIDVSKLSASHAKNVEKTLHEALNLFEPGAQVLDQDGHGTRMTQAVLEHCSRCQILVIKISEHGAGVRPVDLVKALDYAWSKGARVVNLSAGLIEGSPELEQKVRELSKQGLILVTATGHGIKNPFRPLSLNEVFPQAYHPAVLVVGIKADQQKQNYGPEIDVVVEGQDLSPSLAAAQMSGKIAQVLRFLPGVGVRFTRAWLK